MSFYNVTNPTTFAVLDLQNRQGTIQQSALIRADSKQIFTADTTLTAAQVVAGVLFVDTTAAARTITLPSAASLLALLNAGTYASSPISTNDIVFMTVVAYGSGANAVTVQTAGAATSTTVAGRTSEQVGIKFTNVTAGSEAMSVVN
jgi:hypothetical protein